MVNVFVRMDMPITQLEYVLFVVSYLMVLF